MEGAKLSPKRKNGQILAKARQHVPKPPVFHGNMDDPLELKRSIIRLRQENEDIRKQIRLQHTVIQNMSHVIEKQRQVTVDKEVLSPQLSPPLSCPEGSADEDDLKLQKLSGSQAPNTTKHSAAQHAGNAHSVNTAIVRRNGHLVINKLIPKKKVRSENAVDKAAAMDDDVARHHAPATADGYMELLKQLESEVARLQAQERYFLKMIKMFKKGDQQHFEKEKKWKQERTQMYDELSALRGIRKKTSIARKLIADRKIKADAYRVLTEVKMKNFYHFEDTIEHSEKALDTMRQYDECLKVLHTGQHVLLSSDDLYLATILSRYVSTNRHTQQQVEGSVTVLISKARRLCLDHDPPELLDAIATRKLLIVPDRATLVFTQPLEKFDVLIEYAGSSSDLDKYLKPTGERIFLTSRPVQDSYNDICN